MIIYKEDKEYPELLKQTKGAPKQIYCKYCSHSKISERFIPSEREPYTRQKFQNTRSQSKSKASGFDLSIFENCLAVIGSRRLTTYGERVMEQMVSKIAMAGITIVSGFMYGGDAAAHEAAIKAGGRTIAVMPCGIDLIHPAHQKKLYESILESGGLIISEYEGEMKPALWTYPQRNRIVAGLSKALLVIEAGEKSGCLITANCAKKFGRKVFAVPGPITGSLSKGTNLLIKNGAEMVLSAGDVLKYYRSRLDNSHPEFSERFTLKGSDASRKIQNAHFQLKSKAFVAAVRSLEDKILRKLEREPLGIDELSRSLEMLVSELSVKLSLMEIKGLIKLRGNKYYVK